MERKTQKSGGTRPFHDYKDLPGELLDSVISPGTIGQTRTVPELGERRLGRTRGREGLPLRRRPGR